IVINAPHEAREQDIILGNVCFYGATSGNAYINGRAGERFCIRNSGVNVVVEGVGDHGLEYMTGGRVVILGDVGKNFGQGMSGGVSYIFPSNVQTFKEAHALDTLDFDTVTDVKEATMLKQMLIQHVTYTQSKKAQRILEDFEIQLANCIKVIPKDYKQMMQKIYYYEQNQGRQEALLSAFNDHSDIAESKLDTTISVY
ncbi:glutamate synthase subunit alpha, partial [Staphylococcus hyicus]|nr:glutamate synthase subunit alpha [Staphylococcus hyicus]